MYKAPPPEISSEQFYETDATARLRPRVLDPDGLAAADRLGRARARRGALGPGAARVHARLQPLERARRSSPSSCPSPRTASRSPTTADEYGMPVAHFSLQPLRQRRRDHRVREERSCSEIWDGAGAQETLTIDRHAHLVGGARMGFTPDDIRRRPRTIASGASTTCSSSTARVMPTQGAANPALDDHGARRPRRGAASPKGCMTPGAEVSGAERGLDEGEVVVALHDVAPADQPSRVRRRHDDLLLRLAACPGAFGRRLR